MKRFLKVFCVFTIVVIFTRQQLQADGKLAPAPSGRVEYREADCAQRICVPEPAKKKTVRTVYEVKCVHYCLPKCPHLGWLGWLHGNCDGCGSECGPTCGKARTRNVLVKKFVTEESDTVKCVRQLGATKE